MKVLRCAPARKRSNATSIRKKAWRRSCGGTCPNTAKPLVHAVRESARPRSLTATLASCSAWMMSYTADSSGIRCPAGDCAAICREWEADLVLFKQRFEQSNVTSLVERVCRFTVLLKNPNKRTKPVMGKIMKAVRDLPCIARRSITFDRGTELVSWPIFRSRSGRKPGSVIRLRPGRKAP